MFELKNASSGVKKAAYLKGIRSGRYNAWYKPAPYFNEENICAIVGDDFKEVVITTFDAKYASQHTWAELRSPLKFCLPTKSNRMLYID